MSTALVKAREQADNLRRRLSGARDKMKAEGANVMRTGISLATGYGLGMAEARYGEDALAGMDVSLGVGLAATAAAYLDLGGADVTPHLRTVGDASLAVYGYKMGNAAQLERMQRDAA